MATDYKNNFLWQLNSNISVFHLLVLQLSSLPTSCFGIWLKITVFSIHLFLLTQLWQLTKKQRYLSYLAMASDKISYIPSCLQKKVAHLLLWPLITTVVNLFSSLSSYCYGTLKCLSNPFHSLSVCLQLWLVIKQDLIFPSLSAQQALQLLRIFHLFL